MLTEDNTEIRNDWTHGLPVSKEEFSAQITYDLAVFYFFKENYEMATSYFTSCARFFKNVVNKTGFLSIDWNELQGYLLACNTTMEGTNNLLQQLHISIANQYMVSR